MKPYVALLAAAPGLLAVRGPVPQASRAKSVFPERPAAEAPVRPAVDLPPAVAQAFAEPAPAPARVTPPPAADRMMIVREKPERKPDEGKVMGFPETAPGVMSPQSLDPAAVRARIRQAQVRETGLLAFWDSLPQPWQKAGDLRFRVVYKDVYGVVSVGGRYFDVLTRDGSRRAPNPEGNPAFLVGRKAPYYPQGSPFVYEVELELAPGARPRKGVRVFVRQEQIYGDQLAGIQEFTTDVRPGTRAVLSGFFTLRTVGDRAVNLERTNVAVLDADGKVLGHEPYAGIVDPPAR